MIRRYEFTIGSNSSKTHPHKSHTVALVHLGEGLACPGTLRSQTPNRQPLTANCKPQTANRQPLTQQLGQLFTE